MTDNDPPRITDGGENPDSWDHWRIYHAFNPLVPDSAHDASLDYTEIAQRWEQAVDLFNARINHSSTAAWQGLAADSSRNAISKYATEALNLTEPLQTLAQRVGSAVDGINNTRNGVDKPPDGGSMFNPRSWNLGIWHGPSSAAVRHDCENQARERMKTDYVSPFVAADSTIPALPVPNSPTDPLYVPPTGATGPGVPVGPGVSVGPGGPTGITPTSGNGPQGPGASGPGSQQNTQPSSTDSSTTPSGLGASNTPSSSATLPSSYTTPSSTSTTPSGYSPGAGGLGGLGGGLGGAGGGLGGTGGGTTGSGGPGRSVPGTPSTGQAAAAAAAGKATTGTSGMTGMGGMGAGKGKGEGDDKTHALPEWLRNMENTEALLGPEEKTIPGGVIGGDHADPGPIPSE